MSDVADDGNSTKTPWAAEASAERSVVAAALIGGLAAADDAIDAGLRAVDFANPNLGVVWGAIEATQARRGAIDTTTVMDALEFGGQLDKIGGASALAMLEASLPSSAAAAAHARIVMDSALYRQIAGVAHVAQRAASHREAPPAELIAEAQDAFSRLSRRSSPDAGLVDRKATLLRVVARGGRPPENAISTGFSDIDFNLRGGVRPGNVYVIAGRPSMGKSAFAHQIATHIADAGNVVGMFSLEMSGDQLLEREIASRARAPLQNWARDDEAKRVKRAAAEIESRSLLVISLAGLTADSLRARVRRLVQHDGARVIVIDYLQLITPTMTYRGNRNDEIAEVTRTLVALAINLNIPIILLSQLNREVEKRHDKRPLMADLRESGSIEQDAFAIFFLFRPEYYLRDQTPPELRRVAEIIIAKNRDGPIGTIQMLYDGPTYRFMQRASGERRVDMEVDEP